MSMSIKYKKRNRFVTEVLNIYSYIIMLLKFIFTSKKYERRNVTFENNLQLEFLYHTTVKIMTDTGSGTGFFFIFENLKNSNNPVPVIVTNKHVIDGCKECSFVFNLADENHRPKYCGNNIEIKIEKFNELALYHPDNNVDLCILPIGNILSAFDKKDLCPYVQFLQEDMIWDKAMTNFMWPIEDIKMVGYPDGIADEYNNMPIIRTGITATPIKLDYNGKEEFLIDCACFPGSSGSPVFVHKQNYRLFGLFNRKNLIFLSGILYAGPQHQTSGEIIMQPIQNKPTPIINIPNNLGCVIKAYKILDFKPLIEKKLEEELQELSE